MYQHEQKERDRIEEVERSRRLQPPQHRDDRRPGRSDRWRHRQPCPDHKREQEKEHHKVSYVLQHVI